MKNINRINKELQITRGLITLRWVSIPLLLVFTHICLDLFNLSFRKEPIYILAYALAGLNIYFTFHISMLSRQLTLYRGMKSLKGLFLKIISDLLGIIKEKGLLGLLYIPVTITKLSFCIYMMLLESMKDISLNPFSLKNLIRTQIFSDILIIILLTRFTGTTESPLIYLMVIPILISGMLEGLKASFFFSILATSSWIITSLLVKEQLLNHIKFYSPLYGDLNQCDPWIYGTSLVLLFILFALSYLGNKVTKGLSKKIHSLNSLLLESNTKAFTANFASEQQKEAWIITDHNTNIEKLKIDNNYFFSSKLLSKNLREVFKELNNRITDEFITKMSNNKLSYKLEDVSLTNPSNTSGIFNIFLTSFVDYEQNLKLLLFFEDKTKELNLKGQISNLNEELIALTKKLDGITKESAHKTEVIKELKENITSNNSEIDVLMQKIDDLQIIRADNEKSISDLLTELACTKASNEEVLAILECKQMLLNEAANLIAFCGDLFELKEKIETNTRELFNLRNAHLHIFRSSEPEERYEELTNLQIPLTYAHLIPQKDSELLTPALTEGQPVIINAEIKPEQSASLSYKNGELEKMVGYVPIKHNNNTLGMMILEKSTQENKPEVMMEMLSYYLKHASTAITNAINSRNLSHENMKLKDNMDYLQQEINCFKEIIRGECSYQESYNKTLLAFSKLMKIKDSVLIRTDSFERNEIISRLKDHESLELSEFELQIVNKLKSNPDHSTSFKLQDENIAGKAFPLSHKKELLGIFIVYYNVSDGPLDEVALEFCIELLNSTFTLNILAEESEILSNISKSIVAA